MNTPPSAPLLAFWHQHNDHVHARKYDAQLMDMLHTYYMTGAYVAIHYLSDTPLRSDRMERMRELLEELTDFREDILAPNRTST